MTALSNNRGLSVLEVMIALALAAVVIVAALESLRQAQYWQLTAGIASEALQEITRDRFVVARAAKQNFMFASSTATTCTDTVGCFTKQTSVLPLSRCAQTATVGIAWKVGERYGTSSIALPLYLQSHEIIDALGGDCLVVPFDSAWGSATSTVTSVTTTTPAQFTTMVDALSDRLYVVSSSSAQFKIFQSTGPDLSLVAGSSLTGARLNALDVVRDPATGRRYVYIMQHTKSSQLLTVDVTNDIPVITDTDSLAFVDPLGSFPEGWRISVYGNRLYAFSRETAGPELHIFDISKPSQPHEITGGVMNIARTVNDVSVVEVMVAGVKKRYLLLASSAALKELAMIEVTSDIPIERTVVNLPGSENAMSIDVSGNDVIVGRQSVTSGPELYLFSLFDLLHGVTTPKVTREVGASVTSIRTLGSVITLGVDKTGNELQLWQKDPATWSTSASIGRIRTMAFPRLAPLGLDILDGKLVTVAQSAAVPETITLWSIQ